MLLHVSIVHYFLLISSTPLYGYTIDCLSIHVLMNIGLFPILAITK